MDEGLRTGRGVKMSSNGKDDIWFRLSNNLIKKQTNKPQNNNKTPNKQKKNPTKTHTLKTWSYLFSEENKLRADASLRSERKI